MRVIMLIMLIILPIMMLIMHNSIPIMFILIIIVQNNIKSQLVEITESVLLFFFAAIKTLVLMQSFKAIKYV